MIEIDWEKEKEKIQTPFNELENGYYLLKHKDGEEIILSICDYKGHFHYKNTITQDFGDYPNFYKYYEIIGKIKNMKITDIELE